MGASLLDWLTYTLMAVFGLMILDFLIAFVTSFWKGSFNLTFILDYLKDVLYYVVPLYFIVTLSPIDPTGWVLHIFYFILGFAVSLKYLIDIFKKFKSK
jgi:hypothetical protein